MKVRSEMENLKAHFYFSRRQKNLSEQIANDGFDSLYVTYAKIDGKIVEYTEMQLSNEFSNWDDAIYLGYGSPYSVEEVVSVENSLIKRMRNCKTREEADGIKEDIRLLAEYKSGEREYVPLWPDIIGDE